MLKSRNKIIYLLIAGVLVFLISPDSSLCDDKKFRKPSEIWKNVGEMKSTDFQRLNEIKDLDEDKKREIQYELIKGIEEDVKNYIKYELGRLKGKEEQFKGEELYYLGKIYHEIKKYERSISYFEKLIDSGLSTVPKKLIINARTGIIESATKIGDLNKAEFQLAFLDTANAPMLDLLFMEIAIAHMSQNHKKESLSFARRSIQRMSPEMVGFFLEHIITNFITYDMADNALLLIDEIIGSIKGEKNKETLQYFMIRKKQISLIGKPAPKIISQGSGDIWIGTGVPPTEESLSGKSIILYNWAPWCKPCPPFMRSLEKIEKKYKEKGLVVIGNARFYGFIEESQKDKQLSQDQEVKMLNEFLKKINVNFPTIIDKGFRLATDLYVNEIPRITIIDKQGIIRFIRNGPTAELDLIETVVKSSLK